jgi:hypothetical protein
MLIRVVFCCGGFRYQRDVHMNMLFEVGVVVMTLERSGAAIHVAQNLRKRGNVHN